MRRTKQLDAIFLRYEVTVRESNSQFINPANRTMDCDPVAFACLEAAVKAAYIRDAFPNAGTILGEIARINNLSLPKTREPNIEQAAKDYYYCRSKIDGDSSYFGLLDF